LLHDIGLLDEGQVSAFGEALWSQRGEAGFPAGTPFYKWAFLALPHSPAIDVVGLFKSYALAFTFDSVDGGAGGLWHVSEVGRRPVTMTGGRIAFCQDIVAATKRRGGRGFIDWSVDESVVLLDRLVDWWDGGKDRLGDGRAASGFADVAAEFRARYRHLVRILAEVVGPRLEATPDSDARDRLRRLLDELDGHGLAALRAHVGCVPAFPETEGSVLARVANAMGLSDRAQVIDALEATLDLALVAEVNADFRVQRLVAAVAQQIKWRRDLTLVSCLTVMRVIAQKAPERLTEGLEHLRHESDPRAVGPGDIGERLDYRRGAAALARSLHENCVKAGAAPPAVLLEWQRVCADPEEFAEIRSQWEP
jgi:hypothetical protein